MLKIEITKLTPEQLHEKGVERWPIWEKEVSEFPWYYDSTEHCQILEGEVIVTTDTEEVTFGKGDFVTFPKGLACTWKILKPIRKHYNFE
jgi:hypothetical protein